MGLFDKIKKTFNTGGIKVGLEAPKKFDWADQVIYARVTLTGHESEPRTIHHLDFTLEDVGDNQGHPGMRDRDTPHRPDGRRFRSTYQHLIALELPPGEVRTIDVAFPLGTAEGPTVVDRLSLTSGGAVLHFGDQWYELKVAAPVEGANMAKAATAKLKAPGRLGDRTITPG